MNCIIPSFILHFIYVIMSTVASQITGVSIVWSTVYSGAYEKQTPKLCVSGLCVENSPVTSEFPAERASNAENVSIWWRHHVCILNIRELCIPSRQLAPMWVTPIGYLFQNGWKHNWIDNYLSPHKLKAVVTHLSHSCNDGLANSRQKLGHGWVIVYHPKQWEVLLIRI